MTHKAIKLQPVRDIDPNVLQRRAANPDSSVWVAASAGSGKTKVLTDRILRLLLPDKQGMAGTPPHKILALTFTKAGASEMAIRVQHTLSDWATFDNEVLRKKLKNLLGEPPTELQYKIAKQLFAKVVDAPGGLQIMTLHSFCQSVLGRFPLEAGLSPSFILLEEQKAKSLYQKAKEIVLQKAQLEKSSDLANALDNIASIQNAEQFDRLLENFIREQKQVRKLLTKYFNAGGLYETICQTLNIPAGKTKEDYIYDFCLNKNFSVERLKQACQALSEGTPASDQPKAEKIKNWIYTPEKKRFAFYEEYKSAFLKKNGEIFKSLATKPVQKNMPDIDDILRQEARRIEKQEQAIKAIEIANITRDLFILGFEILETYQTLKQNLSALDFDDLILKTLALFNGETTHTKNLSVMPWVRFKMDQGINHILVDEAQDTNPEQWEIIAALCDDFFEHQDEETRRTLFVVGDEKQSIFSFQRASPQKFHQMQNWFSKKISMAQKKFDPVQFNISFRSAPAILDFVDHVFVDDTVKKGLSLEKISHESFRRRQPGRVELWPLFEPDNQDERDPWDPPVEIIQSSSGAAKMATHIGQTIKTWLDQKEPLPSYNRPIEAQDILILVRSRTAFLDQLVRALKIRNIPVSGIDRMVLNQQLVVQDLMAAIHFVLLPEDDLNLAGLLKSPFIGWNEATLFKVAHNRKGSLWQAVKNSDNTDLIDWLSTLIKQAGDTRPYDFIASLLHHKCPSATTGFQAIKGRLGEEALDPLDEFLNHALDFEKDNLPTLQNFVKDTQNNTTEIKRQMEEGGNAVRIMTVHAAKGLQAPIVILPDTIRSTSSITNEKILWPDRTGQDIPYFCPVSETFSEKIEQAKEKIKALADDEYRRLLYVALTRAESALYIGGYLSKQKPMEQSWYYLCRQALEKHPKTKQQGDIICLTNPMTGEPDKKSRQTILPDQKIDAPDWLFKTIPDEPNPPRPLIPSRPSASDNDNDPALSPLQSGDQRRFLRGNITHKLLQLLPDLPPDKRKNAAQKYTALPVHALSEKIQKSIVKETLSILNHPDFAPIFGKGSIAEAPVTGLINGNQMISGQIDRLLITENDILIVDYKTNRPPPKNSADIPDIYRKQMRSYRDVMHEIYPKHTIKTALIWTDGPNLMVVD